MERQDCTYCRHFDLIEGEEDWSELTPGCSPSIGCGLVGGKRGFKDGRWGYWTLESPWTKKQFRLSVLIGADCPDFERTEE